MDMAGVLHGGLIVHVRVNTTKHKLRRCFRYSVIINHDYGNKQKRRFLKTAASSRLKIGDNFKIAKATTNLQYPE